ncbi:MAG: hypothetical protein HY330_03365 [Chloroflexi bacterium]|nr:hypothetical protein [Chloroflexota bacterium]
MKDREGAERLHEAIEGLLAGQPGGEGHAQPGPEDARGLPQLIETATVLHRAVQDLAPREEFRAAARARFHAAFARRPRRSATGRLPAGLASLRPAARLWLSAAASLLLIIAAGAGTVVASSSSVPQEPLYPVKQASERVESFFTLGADSQVRFQLRRAERRLWEIARMEAGGQQAPRALFTAVEAATDRAVDIMAAYAPDQGLVVKQEALQKLAEVNARRQEAFLALLARAEPRVQASLAPAVSRGALDEQRVAAALRTIQEARESLQALPPGARAERAGLITQHSTRLLVVGPYTVRFGDDTILEGRPEVGQVAEVVGVVQPDGSILAQRVRVHPLAPPAGAPGEPVTHKVVATIEAVEPDAWRAAGRTVLVNANTLIVGTPVVGQPAELTVTILPDGRILALRVAALEAAR